MICRPCRDGGDVTTMVRTSHSKQVRSWMESTWADRWAEAARDLHALCEFPGDLDNKAQPAGCTCQHRPQPNDEGPSRV